PHHSLFFFYTRRPPPTSTLFPYTTLFRSSFKFTAEQLVAHCHHPPVGVEEYRCRHAEQAERCDHRIGRREDAVQPRHGQTIAPRSEEHTSELQSRFDLVCRLLLEKKKKKK